MANEKRLISVDNAISHYKALANIAWNEKVAPVSWKEAFEEFIEYLEEAPTVDAVEVVRCKGCIYYHKEIGYGFGQCSKCNLMPYPNDFCSYGERREGE